MYINSPGKVLFYGGYSVLIRGNVSLSLAVVDNKGKGVVVRYKRGKERIISPQFNLNINPLKEVFNEMVVYPYLITKYYLENFGLWDGVELRIKNSPIMGNRRNKSGLGSSAAVISGIVKALYKANGLDINSHLSEIHKIAQYSYALYSGKAGSGFDIATAIFESNIIYKRFDENLLKFPKKLTKKSILENLIYSINRPWKGMEVKKVRLDLDLLVYNIRGKRDSIKASKAFSIWRRENKKEFEKLMKKQNYYEKNAIKSLLSQKYDKVLYYTDKAREVHREMQKSIKEVVKEFEDIESKEFTKLLDKINSIDGVIASRLPGAGGKDSLAVLVKKGKAKKIDKKIMKIKGNIKLNNLGVELL